MDRHTCAPVHPIHLINSAPHRTCRRSKHTKTRQDKTKYTAVTAPQYLSALLTLYTPMRHLRSSHAGLLAVTQTRLRTVGNRAFLSYAHRLWNALPPNIRDAQTQVFLNLI